MLDFWLPIDTKGASSFTESALAARATTFYLFWFQPRLVEPRAITQLMDACAVAGTALLGARLLGSAAARR